MYVRGKGEGRFNLAGAGEEEKALEVNEYKSIKV
jgi:hypothetical protein